MPTVSDAMFSTVETLNFGHIYSYIAVHFPGLSNFLQVTEKISERMMLLISHENYEKVSDNSYFLCV
jgi:hypothetical protein